MWRCLLRQPSGEYLADAGTPHVFVLHATSRAANECKHTCCCAGLADRLDASMAEGLALVPCQRSTIARMMGASLTRVW